jgi:trimeric autotransporter adhesin
VRYERPGRTTASLLKELGLTLPAGSQNILDGGESPLLRGATSATAATNTAAARQLSGSGTAATSSSSVSSSVSSSSVSSDSSWSELRSAQVADDSPAAGASTTAGTATYSDSATVAGDPVHDAESAVSSAAAAGTTSTDTTATTAAAATSAAIAADAVTDAAVDGDSTVITVEEEAWLFSQFAGSAATLRTELQHCTQHAAAVNGASQLRTAAVQAAAAVPLASSVAAAARVEAAREALLLAQLEEVALGAAAPSAARELQQAVTERARCVIYQDKVARCGCIRTRFCC